MSTEREAMTLEQVRDRLRQGYYSKGGGPQIWSGECGDLADAIDAHLAREKADPVAYRWLRNGVPVHATYWISGEPSERQLEAQRACAGEADWQVEYAYTHLTAPAEADERPLE